MRIAPLLLLLLTSCSKPTLTVEPGYFTRKDLASSYVGTPDPNKQKPIFGQRLYITWNHPEADLPLELHIQVRLKKKGFLDKKVPLSTSSGEYIFPIVGNDFTEEGGLLSYKVEILSHDKVIDSSRHKFWVEDIHFSEE